MPRFRFPLFKLFLRLLKIHTPKYRKKDEVETMTNHAQIRPYDQYFLVAFPRFPVVGRVRQLPLNKIFDQGKLEANFVPEFCHICV